MKVKEIITQRPHCITPYTSLAEAAGNMRALDVDLLPVCEGNQLIGLISDRDLAVRGTAEGLDPNTTPVRQVMSCIVFYCFEDQDVKEAAELMEQNRIRRLPVLDHQQQVVGMVALADMANPSQATNLGPRISSRL